MEPHEARLHLIQIWLHLIRALGGALAALGGVLGVLKGHLCLGRLELGGARGDVHRGVVINPIDLLGECVRR